jgi:aminoglycoside 2''-phosphotransferase
MLKVYCGAMMLDEGRARRAMAEAFPDLQVHTVRYFSAGWDYELWEINGELLFRFPLREEYAAPLRAEARLLSELAERLSVAIPRPLHVSDGVESFRQPFYAYRKIPGVPMLEAKLDEEALRATGRQIGQFLRELHSTPIGSVSTCGLPVYSADGWRQFYRDFRARCDERLGKLLPENEREYVGRFWSAFLEDDANFRFTPALVHADLAPDHILVDPERSSLSGIIDFGDARIGDPAIDIVGLLRIEDAVLDGYGNLPDDAFRRRARFYWGVGPFHEVLYGLDIGKQEHIEAGLSGIRARVVGKD